MVFPQEQTSEKFKAKYLRQNLTKLKFVTKIRIPNPVGSFGYTNYCSASSPRPIESFSNLSKLSKDLQLIKRTDQENHTGSEKKGHISLGDHKPIIYKFVKDFTNQRKKTKGAEVFSHTSFPIILKIRDHR